MPEVTGIDHLYITVSDLSRSEVFYDTVLLNTLAFRKNKFTLGGEPHLQYYNRHFGYVLRPARTPTPHDPHDPYAPGLHHFCLRVDSMDEVVAVVATHEVNRMEAFSHSLRPSRATAIYRDRCWFGQSGWPPPKKERT